MSLSKFSAEQKRKIKIIGGASALLIGAYLYYKYAASCCQANKANKKSTSCCSKQESSCCKNKATDYKSIVHSRYSATARNFESAYSKSEQEKLRSIAKVFGYSAEELAEIGSEANMGLSCGNPVKQSKLKKGEIVLDLGCGAGMDLFLAAPLIGDSKDGGQLLGVDFSQDMIDKAVRNAQRKKERKNMDISHFKFMYSDIDDMGKVVEDNYVDCVISNCVMNLLPNKLKAFKEVYRVLKPNGRICLSDIALKQELPDAVKNNVTLFVSCVSGAILAKEYEDMLYQAGFKNVQLVNKNVDLNVWKQSYETAVGCCGTKSSCCGDGNESNDADIRSNMTEEMKTLLTGMDFNDYIASYYVFGYK